MKWSYGITTVPERLNTTLPITMKSLSEAGFDQPRLFIDGAATVRSFQEEYPETPLTLRSPRVYAYANWMMSIYELYAREPHADRFALFQDDFVTVKGLKDYLERSPYPGKGYLNLYTFPSNQNIAPSRLGWYESNQLGKGAVALVFDAAAVATVLSSPHLLGKHRGVPPRNRESIDGGVITAFQQANQKEYVHNPSLTQHIGKISSMGHAPQPSAPSFPGEEFNAMDLLACNSVT